MEAIFSCCAGLDVHKKTVVACVRQLQPDGRVDQHVRTFPDAHWDPQQEQQLRVALLKELMPLMDGTPAEKAGEAARAAGKIFDLLRA